MKNLDDFYSNQSEPVQSCLLALRQLILAQHPALTPAWKWNLPFFDYKGRMLFYLSPSHKKLNLPYLAVTNGNELPHPDLLAEGRTRIRILPIDPEQDLPVTLIQEIVQQAIEQRDAPARVG
ncbi:DUF1801 domain-containing protein [Fibrella aquatica]|jgi:uncharacterized protein YdhG (YjbR/CyaY superfamily)|uniref:DUF1801 domain-containing protein n=1 Tax=Fibrella aquatica TaxID=3242487 RepID=UPI003520A0FE